MPKIRYCKCGCGEESVSTFIRGHNLRIVNPMDNKATIEKMRNSKIGVSPSKETCEKISKTLTGIKRSEETCEKVSKNHARYWKGKTRTFTEEHIEKLSKSLTGKKRSKESIRKQSIALQGNTCAKGHKVSKKTKQYLRELNLGENNPRWNGGIRAYRARRRELGYEPLNEWFPGCATHHVDKEVVIHIPEELHKSISHSQDNKESMKKINDAAFAFYTEQFLEENFPEDLR